MLVEDRDYRWAGSKLQIYYDGQWLTPNQVAYRKEVPIAGGATLTNRVMRAIEGDPKYADASLMDLIMTKAKGKTAFLAPISQCPKTQAIYHLWLAMDPSVLPMWMQMINRARCDRQPYSEGVCHSCYNAMRNATWTKREPSEGAKQRLQAREKTPQRRRAKTLSTRRLRLVEVLLGQEKPIGKRAVQRIVENRFDDLTEDEFDVFVDLTYSAYEAKWLEFHIGDPGAATALMTANQKVSAAQLEEVVKTLTEAIKAKKKRSGKSAAGKR